MFALQSAPQPPVVFFPRPRLPDEREAIQQAKAGGAQPLLEIAVPVVGHSVFVEDLVVRLQLNRSDATRGWVGQEAAQQIDLAALAVDVQ